MLFRLIALTAFGFGFSGFYLGGGGAGSGFRISEWFTLSWIELFNFLSSYNSTKSDANT